MLDTPTSELQCYWASGRAACASADGGGIGAIILHPWGRLVRSMRRMPGKHARRSCWRLGCTSTATAGPLAAHTCARNRSLASATPLLLTAQGGCMHDPMVIANYEAALASGLFSVALRYNMRCAVTTFGPRGGRNRACLARMASRPLPSRQSVSKSASTLRAHPLNASRLQRARPWGQARQEGCPHSAPNPTAARARASRCAGRSRAKASCPDADTEDLLGVCRHVLTSPLPARPGAPGETPPPTRLVLIGYSYGSTVAARALARVPEVSGRRMDAAPGERAPALS
jgi:hypothetical protein